MKYWPAVVALVTFALLGNHAYADPFDYFRYEDGSTRWQYIANFSVSVLVIILSVVLAFLYRAHVRAMKYNRELKNIKASLEERVRERTQDLEASAKQLATSEAYIKGVVDSMPVMLVGLNADLHITQWNSMAETITGRPIADVLGQNLWQAYPAITITPDQAKEVLTRKTTLKLKHSQPGQYSFDITLYPTGDETQSGLVILISDVTKQVNAETKASERDKVSSLGELASAMAFDIRMPLNCISSCLLTAQAQLADSQATQDIRQALASALKVAQRSEQQASAIVDNLLEVTGAPQSEKVPSQIHPIVNHAIDIAHQLFADAQGLNFGKISITRDFDINLPAIQCYPNELVQVFVRLLRSAFYNLNAKQWTDGQEPRIVITINEFYENIWIKLQHNGRTLTPDEQLDIFQPYYSLNNLSPTYPADQRLSYSYFIITNRHQGQMAVTSVEENGTCFNIKLPFHSK